MKYSTIKILMLFLVCTTEADKDKNIGTIWEMIEKALEFLISEIDVHPNTFLDIYHFTTKYNYTLQNYTVATEDDYFLTVHRIPYGRNISEADKHIKRPVVLLAHGMGCSAMDWIWQGPDKAMALLLADIGYDVWLFNARGTIYSLGHKTLTPANSSFWDFSFHEKGYYDMASTIDFVINATGTQNITFVGHSQGTTGLAVLTTSRPEYNAKINLAVMLSPIVYMEHMNSPLVGLLRDHIGLVETAFNLLGLHGLQYNHNFAMFLILLCNDSSSMQGFCQFILNVIAGFDNEQMDVNSLTVFFTNCPAGFSIKDVVHYCQEMKSAHFRRYDYGSIANFLHYGSTTPPSYDISKITAPLALYYAQNDFLAHITDVERFVSELSQDTVERKLLNYSFFNHLDFIIAKDVRTFVYDPVIELIRKHAPLEDFE